MVIRIARIFKTIFSNYVLIPIQFFMQSSTSLKHKLQISIYGAELGPAHPMKAKLGISLGILELKWILNHGFKYAIVLVDFVLLLDIVMGSIFSLSVLTLGSYLMDLCYRHKKGPNSLYVRLQAYTLTWVIDGYKTKNIQVSTCDQWNTIRATIYLS